MKHEQIKISGVSVIHSESFKRLVFLVLLNGQVKRDLFQVKIKVENNIEKSQRRTYCGFCDS